MRNGDRIDKVLLAGLSAVAAIVSLLLAFDVQLFVREPARAPAEGAVARLSVVSSTVRRRPRDVPLWDAAATDEALYARDAVFTEASASATVTLDDDTTIELGESTLVALERTEANPVVNVIKGTLRVAAGAGGGAGLSLMVAGQDLPIRMTRDATLTLKVEKGKPVEVVVLAGKAEVGAAHTSVAAGQTARVAGAQAPVVVAEQTIKLLRPAHGERLVRRPGERLAFGYQIKDGVGRLEIARDAAFIRVIASWAAIAPRFEAPLDGLPGGTYYWRVKAGGEASDVRRFTLALDAGPELVVPAPGARLIGARVVAQLAWYAGEGAAADAAGFRVEWARDRAFTRGVSAAETRAGAHTTGVLDPGVYYWRVREVGAAAGEAPWSAARAFEVVAEAPRKPTAIAAAAPEPEPAVPPRAKVVAPLPAPVTPAPLAPAAASPARAVSAPEFASTPRAAGLTGNQPDAAAPIGLAPPVDVEAMQALPVAASTVAMKAALPAVPAPAKSPAPAANPAPISSPAAVVAPAPAPVLPAGPATKRRPMIAVPPAKASKPAPMAPQKSAESPMPAPLAAPAPVGPPPPAAVAPHSSGAPEVLDPASSPRRRRPEVLSLFAGFTPTLLRYDAATKVRATLFNSYRLGGTLWLLGRAGVDASLLRTSTSLFRSPRAGDPPGQRPLVIQPFSVATALRARLFAGDAVRFDARLGLDAENIVRFRRTAAGTLSARHVLAYGPLLGAELGLAPLTDALLFKLGAAYVHGAGAARAEITRSHTLVLDAAVQLDLGPAPFSLRLGLESRRQRFTAAPSAGDAAPTDCAVDTTALLLELIWQVL